mgnify:CR=1 FL=1
MNEPGFVCSSTGMAEMLANEYGYGYRENLSESDYADIVSSLKPGDIVSIAGHVYMVVGVCGDGSVVIIHSSVTPSVTGEEAGGVQLSAISINGTYDTDCEAYSLACEYTANYPEWESRYPVVMENPQIYFNFTNQNTGIFHWSIDENGLNDPENIIEMDARDVLERIFG